MVLTGGHFVLFQHELTKLSINIKKQMLFYNRNVQITTDSCEGEVENYETKAKRVIESRVVLRLSN